MIRQFSNEDLAQCARRELAHRHRVYARLVREHKMDTATADAELSMMLEIAEYFEEQTSPELFK